MRGNWDNMRQPGGFTPGQLPQFQQIFSDRQIPTHAYQHFQQHFHPYLNNGNPTALSQLAGRPSVSISPDWDRVLGTVKTEDERNDSGWSTGPSHLSSSSPPSRRSSTTTANSTLSSAESVLSPNSSPSQSPPQLTDDLGSSALDLPGSSPSADVPSPSYENVPSVEGQVKTSNKGRRGKKSQNASNESQLGIENLPSTSTGSIGPKMNCPICRFSSTDKHEFSEHLPIHCNTSKSSSHEMIKSVLEQLERKSVNKSSDTSRSTTPEVENNDDKFQRELSAEDLGINVPQVNSQGKVKTFKCKQCAFVAITKSDFWDHTRVHIKPEKMLSCHLCNFVSEYKHHLEYHLRNHSNSKPYKCSSCSYTCVNKSMLNSHLKSHTNICPFRCATCNYQTKYVHSLKTHLRSLKHQPGDVLNPDGTVNPYTVIDVYGTRRGPKTKGPKKVTEPNVEVQIPPPTQVSYQPLMQPLLSQMMVNPFDFNMAASMMLQQSIINNYKIQEQQQLQQQEQMEEETYLDNGAPLDLSNNNEVEDKTKVASRRKGKAKKLERLVVKKEGDDEMDHNNANVLTTQVDNTSEVGHNDFEDSHSDSENNTSETSQNDSKSLPNPGSSSNQDNNNLPEVRTYTCEWCVISFGNEMMFAEHMNFHTKGDPFTCNICKVSCFHSVAFYHHLCSAKH